MLFQGARGSGQPWQGNSSDGYTGFGPQVYSLYKQFNAGINGVQLDSIGQAYASNSTDLLKPSKLDTLLTYGIKVGRWLAGLNNGVNAAYKTLLNRSTSCPNEKIVLAGYSQGAMLEHRVLYKLATDHRTTILNRIIGVALIGDGDRVRNSKVASLVGNPAAGIAGSGVAAQVGVATEGDVPAQVQGVTINVCTKSDIVCDFQFPWILKNSSAALMAHTQSYTQNPALLGSVATQFRRRLPSGGHTIVGVSAGAFHACAILYGGTAKCWGANGVGQLGNGTNSDSTVPVQVTGLSVGVSAISADGWSYIGLTCAIVNGGAECWGENESGELGNGTNTGPQQCSSIGGTYPCSTSPVQVTGLTSGVTAISTAWGGNACAIVNGGAYCWGNNSYGQLGNGTTTDSSVPVQVSGLTAGVTSISAGGLHACAVMNGGAYCWGDNSTGELGNGSTASSTVPVQVTGLSSGATSISARSNHGAFSMGHTCAVVSGGATCWGANPNGELGDGTNTGPELCGALPQIQCSTVPVQVSGLTNGAVSIAAGGMDTWQPMFYSCAVVLSGAKCWGSGVEGTLGDGGSETQSDVAVQVSGITTGVTALGTSGQWQACAVANSRAWCWGNGVPVPAQIPGL